MIIRASGLRSWDMMPAEWELRTLRNPPTFARFNRKIVRLDDAHFGFREHLQQQIIVHQRPTEREQPLAAQGSGELVPTQFLVIIP